jgi:hypothetical protein
MRPHDRRILAGHSAARGRRLALPSSSGRGRLETDGDAINSITWALVGDFFGRKSFATIRGWIGMIQSFATMPAAVFTGCVYDQTQSYSAALVLWRAAPPVQQR